MWHCGHQLALALQLLGHSIVSAVSLSTVMEVRACVSLPCERLGQLLDDLTSLLDPASTLPDLHQPDSFTKQVDAVLEVLDGRDTEERGSGVGQRVKILLENILKHSLTIAQCGGGGGGGSGSGGGGGGGQPSPLIMSLADKVIKKLKDLINTETTTTTTSTSTTTTTTTKGGYSKVDEQVARERLGESVEQLEEAVNTCMITLIVQTFAAPLAPLHSLLASVEQAEGKWMQTQVDEAIQAFDFHTDEIFQTAGLAMACTSNRRSQRYIQTYLSTLEWLEGVLIPAIQTHTNTHVRTHTHALTKHWSRVVEGLKQCLDDMVDPAAFVLVTTREVQKTWAVIKDSLYTPNIIWLQGKVQIILNLTQNILSLSSTSSTSSSSSSSWMPDYVEQDLKCAVREVRGALGRVRASPSTLSHHRSLLKRVQLTLTLLSRLSTSLESAACSDTAVSRCGGGGGDGGGGGGGLTEEEKHHLVTSNIASLPVDSPSTPSSTPTPPPPARLGEGRGRLGISGLGPTTDTLPCDTTLEISRYLSRSSTVLSSMRGSRQNFSLKVREINLDLEGALEGVRAPLPHHPPPPRTKKWKRRRKRRRKKKRRRRRRRRRRKQD
ncbi:uncharacterized protein LOC135096497 [Scylla paramamosain]|uniref:uncharacterized protein LOC135096497 n=1 Tax=Scylla paramamosain TaxID=85552 RepID=UPI003083BA0E